MLKSNDTLWQYFMYKFLNSILAIIHRFYYTSFLILIGGSVTLLFFSRPTSYVLFSITGLLLLFTNIVSGQSKKCKLQAGTYKNSRLEVGTIPKLILNEPTPHQNGIAHGVLLGPQIIQIIRWYGKFWRSSVMDINILPEYLRDELNGIVVGVNSSTGKHITTEQLIKVCQVADVYSACTCICAFVNGSWIFGRNMDWIPFQMAQNSIVIQYPNGTHSLTAPGIIGVITAWRNNLRMAMNVCPDPTIYNPKGLPSVFYNRILIDKFLSIVDIQNNFDENKPRNAYHLTLCDGVNACTIGIYQGDNNTNLIRNNSPFFVVNDSKLGKSAFLSGNRLNKLSKMAFNSVEDVITGLDRCKSWETVHTVVFNGNEVRIGIDNGYAVAKLIAFSS